MCETYVPRLTKCVKWLSIDKFWIQWVLSRDHFTIWMIRRWVQVGLASKSHIVNDAVFLIIAMRHKTETCVKKREVWKVWMQWPKKSALQTIFWSLALMPSWIKLAPFQLVLGYFGSWLGFYGSFWVVMGRIGLLWIVLAHFGSFWLIQFQFHISILYIQFVNIIN